MTPIEIVKKWVELFNEGNAEHISKLYYSDAINHQVTQEPVEGRENIKAMFAKEFGSAKMTCIPEKVHDAGDTAILEWSDPNGLRGCGFFAVVDSKISFQRGYWDKLSFLKLHGLPIE